MILYIIKYGIMTDIISIVAPGTDKFESFRDIFNDVKLTDIKKEYDDNGKYYLIENVIDSVPISERIYFMVFINDYLIPYIEKMEAADDCTRILKDLDITIETDKDDKDKHDEEIDLLLSDEYKILREIFATTKYSDLKETYDIYDSANALDSFADAINDMCHVPAYKLMMSKFVDSVLIPSLKKNSDNMAIVPVEHAAYDYNYGDAEYTFAEMQKDKRADEMEVVQEASMYRCVNGVIDLTSGILNAGITLNVIEKLRGIPDKNNVVKLILRHNKLLFGDMSMLAQYIHLFPLLEYIDFRDNNVASLVSIEGYINDILSKSRVRWIDIRNNPCVNDRASIKSLKKRVLWGIIWCPKKEMNALETYVPDDDRRCVIDKTHALFRQEIET